MGDFASGVLTQLASTISLDDDSLMARASGLAAARHDGQLTIIAATGRFETAQGKPLNAVDDATAIQCVEQAVKEKRNIFTQGAFVGYYRTGSGSENVIYLHGANPIRESDQNLIEIFSSNISAAFDNMDLNQVITETQKELLFTLGDVVETRSPETANHVRRVAEYSHLLALKAGMSREDADRFKMASPMHDVGKIGIPDSVLLKPGPLNEEDFELIKTHTRIGHAILKGSPRPVMQMAATVALQHHERWDGTGYPDGLKGEAIDLVGRITMIADIFDALGCDRVYKKAWLTSDILNYLEENKGTMLDPTLVDLFMKHLDEILAIKERFPDTGE